MFPRFQSIKGPSLPAMGMKLPKISAPKMPSLSIKQPKMMSSSKMPGAGSMKAPNFANLTKTAKLPTAPKMQILHNAIRKNAGL